MTASRRNEITHLLVDLRGQQGTDAWGQLVPLVYTELHQLAHRQLARMRPGETLNTTALVHEAFLKLANQEEATYNDRIHFFRVAARAMRHVLVDYALKLKTAKRGSGQPNVPLIEHTLVSPERAQEVLALDEALNQLALLDERQSEIVELRYFTGFTIAETAEAMQISPATVKREWTSARAWLHQHIKQALN